MEDSNRKLPDKENRTEKSKELLSSGKGLVSRRSLLRAAGTALTLPLIAGTTLGSSETHLLEIISDKKTKEVNELDVSYEFTADGEITPDTDNGSSSAEENDSVTQNNDGSWTAKGTTGNGFGDSYQVNGNITEFEATGSYTIRLDGDTISANELTSESEHVLEILTDKSPSVLDYEFTTTGEIRHYTDNGKNSSEEGNDNIIQNDDGTWTVNGYTGNGYGDAFYFTGDLIEFGPIEDFLELRIDGSPIDLEQFKPEKRVLEVLTDKDPSVLDYTATTTGEIEPFTDNGKNSAEDNDSIVKNDNDTWTIDGYTGNGYGDAFYFAGELVDFGPVEDFVEVRINGTAVDLSKYENKTSPDGPNDEIGGGEGYANTVPQSEADITVASLSELLDALESASSGDIVYIAGDAIIDATSVTGTSQLTVPSGVTLASDRGINGAPGAHIKTDTIDYEHMMAIKSDVRLTGLRLSGPLDGYQESSKPVSSGVTVEGSDCEVDNVEISGFNHAALKLRHSTYIHHSHIHDNPMSGLGYGVQCLSGDSTLIEYNLFEFNRHSVASGSGEAGYEVRYNYFDGTETPAYQVGTHRPGGTTLKIHHNTFVPTKHMGQNPADPGSHISIRGVPEDIADIHHNWFYNPLKPSPGRGDESVIQPYADEFTNLRLDSNQYGSEEPSDEIGSPR